MLRQTPLQPNLPGHPPHYFLLLSYNRDALLPFGVPCRRRYRRSSPHTPTAADAEQSHGAAEQPERLPPERVAPAGGRDKQARVGHTRAGRPPLGQAQAARGIPEDRVFLSFAWRPFAESVVAAAAVAAAIDAPGTRATAESPPALQAARRDPASLPCGYGSSPPQTSAMLARSYAALVALPAANCGRLAETPTNGSGGGGAFGAAAATTTPSPTAKALTRGGCCCCR